MELPILKNNFNVQDKFKMVSFEELKDIQYKDTYPYSVAAFNFDGSLNLGVLIRTAVLFGARDFYIIGKKRYDRRSTVGAHNYINVHHITYDSENDEIQEILTTLNKYRIICIEQNGYDLLEYNIGNICEVSWKPSCFVFGSESKGITKKLLSNSEIVSIPQIGIMRCLNVATCGAIVLHHISRKWKGEL